MKHLLNQIFHSPRFVVGFVIFMCVLLYALIYPAVSPYTALQIVSNKSFSEPGTYVNVIDTINNNDTNNGGSVQLQVDTTSAKIESALDKESRQMMIDWLYKYGGVEEGSLSTDDMESVIAAWVEKYDGSLSPKTETKAQRNKWEAINKEIINIQNESGYVIAVEGEEGLEQAEGVINPEAQDFVNTKDISSTVTFPLGTDNFGRDEATELASAIRVSLRVGLVAGLIATAIGLTLGLVAGYVGGWVDNLIIFLTNLFTVIPSFVLLILIANSISSSARGVMLVAVLIGITAWPWTCRSVRSQVISLRNRDHVNMSKLSGHSMFYIITRDILPYVASYVVMAMILQISSGILSEAQLSMLGLGPSTTKYTTLGLMMNWATTFTAHLQGAWWAFLTVILAIALISFSLNLMNTGLDQVFNPTLRD